MGGNSDRGGGAISQVVAPLIGRTNEEKVAKRNQASIRQRSGSKTAAKGRDTILAEAIGDTVEITKSLLGE